MSSGTSVGVSVVGSSSSSQRANSFIIWKTRRRLSKRGVREDVREGSKEHGKEVGREAGSLPFGLRLCGFTNAKTVSYPYLAMDDIDMIHVDTQGRKLYLRLYRRPHERTGSKMLSVARTRDGHRNQDAHGSWTWHHSEDAASDGPGLGGGTFTLEFHWDNDNAKTKCIELSQIDDQNFYISVKPDIAWSSFAIVMRHSEAFGQ
jgi:hypothetical protein